MRMLVVEKISIFMWTPFVWELVQVRMKFEPGIWTNFEGSSCEGMWRNVAEKSKGMQRFH
jgi:hypothetical protein